MGLGSRLRGIGAPQEIGFAGGTVPNATTFSAGVTFSSTATFNGAATFNSSVNFTPVTITNSNSPYTLGAATLLYCDCTSGAITVNLPAASAGRFYIIEKTDSTTNAVTINRAGSDTIEGATSFVLPTQYDQIQLIGGSSIWYQTNNVWRIRSTTTSFNAANIVGTGAGTLGNANGITVVSAVSGYRVQLEEAKLQFTYSTAAYGGGGNLNFRYSDSPAANITSAISASGSFGATTDRQVFFGVANGGNALSTTGVGASLIIASTAFTNPGTAAGTGTMITYYRLVTV